MGGLAKVMFIGKGSQILGLFEDFIISNGTSKFHIGMECSVLIAFVKCYENRKIDCFKS